MVFNEIFNALGNIGHQRIFPQLDGRANEIVKTIETPEDCLRMISRLDDVVEELPENPEDREMLERCVQARALRIAQEQMKIPDNKIPRIRR